MIINDSPSLSSIIYEVPKATNCPTRQRPVPSFERPPGEQMVVPPLWTTLALGEWPSICINIYMLIVCIIHVYFVLWYILWYIHTVCIHIIMHILCSIYISCIYNYEYIYIYIIHNIYIYIIHASYYTYIYITCIFTFLLNIIYISYLSWILLSLTWNSHIKHCYSISER
jgi:hypothetical protein